MKINLPMLAIAAAYLFVQGSGYAGEYPDYDANLVGGFTFEQYVVLKPGGSEIMAAKGILFIARKPFSKAEINMVRQARFGKGALAVGKQFVRSGGANVCAVIIPTNVAQGVPIDYPPLAISRARGSGDAVDVTLITFVDNWFGWHVRASGSSIDIHPFPDSTLQWRWKTTRFVTKAAPDMSLKKCLQYSNAHAEEVRKARKEFAKHYSKDAQ